MSRWWSQRNNHHLLFTFENVAKWQNWQIVLLIFFIKSYIKKYLYKMPIMPFCHKSISTLFFGWGVK